LLVMKYGIVDNEMQVNTRSNVYMLFQ